MSDPPRTTRGESTGASSGATDPATPTSSKSLFDRLKEHKVAQWTLAYAAFAYTSLHTVEMLSDAQDWPRVVLRLFSFLLLLGVPIVVTLAWYHGARAMRRISGPELLIITLLCVIAGSLLSYLQRQQRIEQVPATVSTVATANNVAPAPRSSIAVMPFVNMTGDASKDYLGDGMAEEVIDKLTEVQGLKIPARTSSFAYKGRNADIRQIARDLGVGTILEGSVRAAGERIRITAQLINAQDGLHLWSHTYDERFTDLFKLQDDLAQSIVGVLTAKLGVALTELKRSQPTQDVEAYELYLQAGAALDGTEPGFRKAISLLDQALGRDPGFARALAARANARLNAAGLGYGSPTTLQDAEHDAGQALSLDPSLAAAQSVLGQINAGRGNWIAAESNFRAAISQEPGDPLFRSAYSLFHLLQVGHMRQAVAQTREAYRLAPADKYSVYGLAVVSTLAGLDTEALASANLAIRLGVPANVMPMPRVFVNAAMRARHFDKAAEYAASTLTPAMRAAGAEPAVRDFYAALADSAKRPAAVLALEQLWPKSPDPFLANEVIYDLAQLDELDAAFTLANKCIRARGCGWGFVWTPEMRPFRRDPRFPAFAEHLGMTDYWKQYGPPDGCDLTSERLSCQ